MRALDYFQPVLGLPDTLKSKLLIPFRENLVSSFLDEFKENIQFYNVDFDKLLISANPEKSKVWKPLREGVTESKTTYPVLDSYAVPICKKSIRKETVQMIRITFPSLVNKDIVSPSDDWIPDS